MLFGSLPIENPGYAYVSEGIFKEFDCKIKTFVESLVLVESYQEQLKQLTLLNRGGVEDTRLEVKAKDTKKIRGQGQGQPFRGQTLSRPRTGMLEAKAKNQGHKSKCSPKKRS